MRRGEHRWMVLLCVSWLLQQKVLAFTCWRGRAVSAIVGIGHCPSRWRTVTSTTAMSQHVDIESATVTSTNVGITKPKKLICVIAGPTASGKSDVAAALCHANGGSFPHGLIVSADSVQAYPFVQIGANKPTEAELQATPHLLIDVVPPSSSPPRRTTATTGATDTATEECTLNYSVNDWRRDAMYVIRKMFNESTTTAIDDDDDDNLQSETSDVVALQERRRGLDATIRAAIRKVQTRRQHPHSDDPTTNEAAVNDCDSSITTTTTPTISLMPFVVGGSMMYLQWLVHGRPDAVRPTTTAVQRAQTALCVFETSKDWNAAVQTLVLDAELGSPFTDQLDKITEGGVKQDWYRLRRLLEVAYTLQEKQQQSPATSAHHKEDNASKDTSATVAADVYSGQRTGGLLANEDYDVRCFFLCPDDRMKHCKIVDLRCEEMICRGLVAETTDLVLGENMPDMVSRAIGYRQTIDYLQQRQQRDMATIVGTNANTTNNDTSEQDFADYVAQFTAATRQYSKKQMQWFRRDAAFTFVPVPISTMPDKSDRVQAVAQHIGRLLQLPRDEYDAQRSSPTSESARTRARNEQQAKGMKVYQFVKQILKPGSQELVDALAEADRCTRLFHAKKRRLCDTRDD